MVKVMQKDLQTFHLALFALLCLANRMSKTRTFLFTLELSSARMVCSLATGKRDSLAVTSARSCEMPTLSRKTPRRRFRANFRGRP